MPSLRRQSGAPNSIIYTNLCLFVEDVENNLDMEMGLNMLETPLLIA